MCFVYHKNVKHMHTAGENNKINIRNEICRDTAKTVHFFLNTWNVCVCLYFWLSIPFRSHCISLRFFLLIFFSPLLCCLLFWAHVHKWLLLTLYWFNTECAVEVEKNEFFCSFVCCCAYCRRILGDDIHFEKTSYGSV